MDTTFLQARITATQAEIVAYENAILAITTGGAASYTLDTGQNTQTVTKLNLSSMQKTLDGLLNRLAIYEARLYGNNVVTGRPAF